MIKTLTNLFKQDKEKFVVPKGVQDVIPVAAIFDDGIFKVGKDKYSKTYRFTDINYAYCGNRIYEAEFTMSATTKPIKDKIPAQAYLLHTICFLDTGSDTAYFPHFHCSSQVVREIIIDIISIGMSKKLIYIVPLFSNMNINAIIMAISIITRGKPYFFLIVRKSFVNSPFISFPPLHRKA